MEYSASAARYGTVRKQAAQAMRQLATTLSVREARLPL
jgi:hypothetical protein